MGSGDDFDDEPHPTESATTAPETSDAPKMIFVSFIY
jgi:hypothetical protein